MDANGLDLVRTVKSRKSSSREESLISAFFGPIFTLITILFGLFESECRDHTADARPRGMTFFVWSPLVRKLFPMKRKQRKGSELFYFHFIFLHKFTHFQIVGWGPQPSKYAIHYDVLQLFQVTSFDNKQNGRMKRNAKKLCLKSSAFARQHFYAMYDVVGLARPSACIVRVKTYVKSFANSETFAGMLDGMPIFVFRSLKILWMVCCIWVR